MMEVNVHIEAISFAGLGRADSMRAAASFQSELTRLFESHSGGLQADGESLKLAASVPPQSKPERMGAEAARSLYEGLRQ